MPLEIELKYALSKTQYTHLLAYLRTWIVRRQHIENFYIDDSKLTLRRSRIGLRLRRVDKTKYFLTLKFDPKNPPHRRTRGLSVRHEIEETMNGPLARRFLSDFSGRALPRRFVRWLLRLCPSLDLKELGILGKLSLFRVIHELPAVGIIELDKGSLGGENFYELEIETSKPHETQRRLHLLLKKLGMKPRPSQKSKLARFLEKQSEVAGNRIRCENRRSKPSPRIKI